MIGRALGGGNGDGAATDGEPPMTTTTDTKPTVKRQRKMAREPQTTVRAAAPRSTKANAVIELLCSAGGATLNELIAATSWLPHTTRAALTGLKKKGHVVTSEKLDGVRRYRIESGKA